MLRFAEAVYESADIGIPFLPLASPSRVSRPPSPRRPCPDGVGCFFVKTLAAVRVENLLRFECEAHGRLFAFLRHLVMIVGLRDPLFPHPRPPPIVCQSEFRVVILNALHTGFKFFSACFANVLRQPRSETFGSLYLIFLS